MPPTDEASPWQALRQVQGGFYVDIGPGSTLTARELARLCAEDGWRGVHLDLDPGQDLAREAAVSAVSGAQALGIDWQARVPEGQPVHLLRVHESAALQAGSLAGPRAAYVIVEGDRSHETAALWLAQLLRAGYEPMGQDGGQRFFQARSQATGAAATVVPAGESPDVLGSFIRAGGASGAAVPGSRAALPTASRHIEEARVLRRNLREQQRALHDTRVELEQLRQHAQALQMSPAWRLGSRLMRVAGRVPRPLRRAARSLAKAAFWALTPWKIGTRLRFRRDSDAALPARLDLFDDAQRCRVALRPAGGFFDTPAGQPASADTLAARQVLDLLRARPELRTRFPRALSEPEASGFAAFLSSDADLASQHDAATRAGMLAALRSDPGARARNLFLHRVDLRERLPHGLLPAGQPRLLRWFMTVGLREHALQPEEILWLFVQASENPTLELARAFRFTPEWQALHPDALGVFGVDAFLDWFEPRFGQVRGSVDADAWAVQVEPERQLRQAYFARPEWQARHPRALQDATAARGLLAWLASDAVGLAPAALRFVRSLDADTVAQAMVADGLNLIGHFCTASGVRISAESIAAGLAQVGVRTSLRDLRTDVSDEPRHHQFGDLEDWDITLIHTQPEPFFPIAYARCDLAERKPRSWRIAYWYWEFDSIPDSWIALAAQADEVWTATEFVARGLRSQLSLPVRTMFPGVRLAPYRPLGKAHFGLPQDGFVFLFNFHMNSVMERKNPVGLVQAFRRAFDPSENVHLVIKTLFGHRHPAQMKQLREAADGVRVRIIDESYSPEETLALTDACDAYVSLHRSEGLGLTMAEAMLMGKPVIATGFSGNVDFMDANNSLLVGFERVPLGRAHPPYDEHLSWAEPSIGEAAAAMRRVVDQPDFARALGQRARASATERLSVEAAGQRIARRLREIRADLHAQAPAPAQTPAQPRPGEPLN